MAKKILLAGILGGVALFLWGGLSHMVLGLGDHGIQALDRAPVTESMKASITQPGFFYFPTADKSGKIRAEDVNGAWGLLIYHPTGATDSMGRQLAIECVLNIVQALIAAYLLTLVTTLTGYAGRVGFVILAGLLTGGAIFIEYWNWYGFPNNYTEAMLLDRFLGLLILGLVVAAFIKPATARIQAVPAKAA